MIFKGTYLGLPYLIDLKDEQEFKAWLKSEVLRFVFNMKEGVEMTTLKQNDSIELQVLKEILAGDYS